MLGAPTTKKLLEYCVSKKDKVILKYNFKTIVKGFTVERIFLLCLLTGVLWYFYWPFHTDPEEIQFYYRAGGSNNGWETSFDYLKITNYTNRSVTAKHLYQYAQHYVDTVKAKYPVSDVTFVGQTPNGSLPYDIAEDMFDQVGRQSLISFSFSNIFPQPPEAEKKLIELAIYKDGKVISYDNSQEGKEKKVIHDTLTSDKPFDNGFKGRNPFVATLLGVVFGVFILVILIRNIAGSEQFHPRR